MKAIIFTFEDDREITVDYEEPENFNFDTWREQAEYMARVHYNKYDSADYAYRCFVEDWIKEQHPELGILSVLEVA